MHAEHDVIHVLDTRNVVHVDEIEHAPSVSELGAVVEVRFRKNATVTFVPMLWRYDKPCVANLRKGKVKQNALGRNCVNEDNKATHMRGSAWVIRFNL